MRYQRTFIFGILLAALVGVAVAGVGAQRRGDNQERGSVERRDRDEVIIAPGDAVRRAMRLDGRGSQIGVMVSDPDASGSGVRIDDVDDDGPAATAGVKEGDLVVEFDGERVRSARQFTRLVQETPVERQVQTVVMRDGQRMTLSVQLQSTDNFSYFRDFSRGNSFKLAPRPPAPPAPPKPPVFDFLPRIERMFSSSGRLGITVDSLSEQLAGYFGTKDGVLVTSVNKDSAAAKAGLKAGDVITAIDGSTVDSPSDLSSQTQRLDSGTEFTLDIVRDKKPMTLKGKVEAPRARRWTVSTD
jgi:serine protease Do